MPPDIFATTTEMNTVVVGIKKILQILLSSDLQHQLWPLQIIFVLLAIFFAWMVVYYSITTSYWDYRFLGDAKNFLFPKVFEKKAQVRRWQKIQEGLEKHHEDQWKLSLIDAAGFLDECLRTAGFGGSNLGERLQRVTIDDVSNVSGLINAQRVCSDIVHDPNYRLSKSTAKEVIGQIEQGLKELGIL